MVDFRTVLGRVASGLKSALFPAQQKASRSESTSHRRAARTDRSDSGAIKLFVGNIPYAMNDDSLRTLFEKYGKVVRAEIVTDRTTNASRGFGFVEMPSEEEARIAIGATNGREFDGRAIIVDRAKAKQRQRSDNGSRSASARGNRSRHGRSSSRGGRRSDHRTQETQRSS